MLEIDRLPTSEELPDSDETPVDNELQNYIPNLLLFTLDFIWRDREDWYFGADMGIYHTTGGNHCIPVIPDGFLSIGVPRYKGSGGRRSYVLWEENYIPPILVLEIVSHNYNNEYTEKLEIYRRLGVLYCVIYNPFFYQHDRRNPLEIYKLIAGEYVLQVGEPYWMPEIGLGLGRYPATPYELLGWFNQEGDRYLTPDEVANLERKRADKMQKELESLRQKLKEMGIENEQ
ncbi:MAG: Uma2 family endonuclease [Pseudanabaenaceae cyanobacterium SKYGB_i_bin29]|nr:Uma2 family endonuclease [Pseudanabaenaceae cyanobacterium SKYG29]MDW8422019.1 Uma2 family endonuclease [Pseudanabaenaceae cyanobacterium SKYGB_i_bin29]